MTTRKYFLKTAAGVTAGVATGASLDVSILNHNYTEDKNPDRALPDDLPLKSQHHGNHHPQESEESTIGGAVSATSNAFHQAQKNPSGAIISTALSAIGGGSVGSIASQSVERASNFVGQLSERKEGAKPSI
jgi:hypothetical protein